MEQCGSFGWFYYNEDYEGIGELKQLLLQSRLELDATILSAQDEITRKEEELIHLKELLLVTMKERDEANAKCEKLTLENFSLQHELQNHQQNQQLLLQKQHKAASITRGMSAEDKCKAGDTNTSFSCSDTEESIVSSPGNTEVIHPQNISTSPSYFPLPEKGKLLKAVVEAGPLLQTLLLAGQLPKWQHPPPRLDSIEIPLIRISSSVDGESSKKLLLIFLTARLPHPAASMKAWVDIEYCKASKRKSATNQISCFQNMRQAKGLQKSRAPCLEDPEQLLDVP